jgi:hypothetical protein
MQMPIPMQPYNTNNKSNAMTMTKAMQWNANEKTNATMQPMTKAMCALEKFLWGVSSSEKWQECRGLISVCCHLTGHRQNARNLIHLRLFPPNFNIEKSVKKRNPRSSLLCPPGRSPMWRFPEFRRRQKIRLKKAFIENKTSRVGEDFRFARFFLGQETETAKNVPINHKI